MRILSYSPYYCCDNILKSCHLLRLGEQHSEGDMDRWPQPFQGHHLQNSKRKAVIKTTHSSKFIYKYIRGKNFLKCSLVLRTSTPKFLLVLMPNNAGHSRKYNLALHFFYLSVRHWMKIYACPDWNFTCPGHQEKWFFYPCIYVYKVKPL